MDRAIAEKLLIEAESMNKGAWVDHSYKAYIFGLLHDIGRRNGNMQARHAIEGYKYLTHIGFDEEARICLTHTFQYQDVEAIYDTNSIV